MLSRSATPDPTSLLIVSQKNKEKQKKVERKQGDEKKEQYSVEEK